MHPAHVHVRQCNGANDRAAERLRGAPEEVSNVKLNPVLILEERLNAVAVGHMTIKVCVCRQDNVHGLDLAIARPAIWRSSFQIT